MAYGTRRFYAAFTRTLQQSLSWAESTQFLVLIPIYLKPTLILSSHLRLGLSKGLDIILPGRWKQENPKQTWKDTILASMGKRDMTKNRWMVNFGKKKIVSLDLECLWIQRKILLSNNNNNNNNNSNNNKSACLTTDHEDAGSIPGTSTNFKCGLGLEQGPPSLVRTIG